METKTLICRCACGKFQAKLTGLPQGSAVCHCHSCVAAGKFIDDKFHGTNTSVLKNGGAFVVTFPASRINFITPDLSNVAAQNDMLGFVKIGEKGSPFRAYTKCCGTQIFTLVERNLSTYCGFNGNCIYEEDGVTPFRIGEEPVNIMAKFAFDPKAVPDPKVNYVTLQVAFNIVKNILNPFAEKFKDEAIFANENSTVDTVPITWEKKK